MPHDRLLLPVPKKDILTVGVRFATVNQRAVGYRSIVTVSVSLYLMYLRSLVRILLHKKKIKTGKIKTRCNNVSAYEGSYELVESILLISHLAKRQMRRYIRLSIISVLQIWIYVINICILWKCVLVQVHTGDGRCRTELWPHSTVSAEVVFSIWQWWICHKACCFTQPSLILTMIRWAQRWVG